MIKKGDTLIEVTLAVGIFSMIAVAIAAVMSSGTAGAQTALETTLTREEIDTQAETLRFIQNSYSLGKDVTDDNKISILWHKITDNAIDLPNGSEESQSILQYIPNSCSDIYNSADNSTILDHAFVVNPRQVGNFINDLDGANIDSVYIPYQDGTGGTTGKLIETSLYPRLVYGSTDADANADAQALTSSSNDNLYRAEGIYVIAVKDVNTTTLVNEDPSTTFDSEPAFYDFYIRTCWYGTDANQPSTISTVIRLYNPDAV